MDITYTHFKQYLSPPNEIIPPNNGVVPPSNTTLPSSNCTILPPPIREPDSSSSESVIEGRVTLFSQYHEDSLVFLRYGEKGEKYFASVFAGERKLKRYVGMMREQTALRFDCNYESGNLFAVYKVGQSEYDLILQNDSNTTGYTQWFDFAVSNSHFPLTARFNLVNFYKQSSLHQKGMKPATRSLRHSQKWRRGVCGVSYFENDILMEGRKGKLYSTLSFTYTFLQEDTVQFAHSVPFKHSQCEEFIKNISHSGKVSISRHSKLTVMHIGTTILKKAIPCLHIGSPEQKTGKRALIFLARQHPGETPSSHVLQELMMGLLGNRLESEFILDRFDVYIFPMVNVDGVVLGNYRCNAAGHDLNRCWKSQNIREQPEVVYIKSKIGQIMKKQAVELILDLHGHSNKMNSFFYGNRFGKHNMLFPFIASKVSPLVDFRSCKFEDESNSTARSVLGSLIKETGSVYTFEISFFGTLKNGRPTHFGTQDYAQLGETLLVAIYKMYLEIFKEQKGLTQSLYLKKANRDLRRVHLDQQDQGSDQEALQTATFQAQELKTVHKTERKQCSVESREGARLHPTNKIIEQSSHISTQTQHSGQIQTVFEPERKSHRIREIRRHSNYLLQAIDLGEFSQEICRKQFLMDHLRINGKPVKEQLRPNEKASQTEQSLIATHRQHLRHLQHRQDRDGRGRLRMQICESSTQVHERQDSACEGNFESIASKTASQKKSFLIRFRSEKKSRFPY